MEYIPIRNLQHYLYCPHRWGLIEIDRAWAENAFVVKANLLHNRVHSGDSYFSRGKKVYTNIDVWDDTLGLIGKVDCVERQGDQLCIVEYKPTMPSGGGIRHEDAIQLFAQKLCLDGTFGIDCKTEMYYSDVRKRYAVDFSTDKVAYYEELQRILAEMHIFIVAGSIPPIREGQKCNGCSMKDLCMPSIVTKHRHSPLREMIEKEVCK